MHSSFNRRTAPKVKDGQVQRKNRHRPTAHQGYVLDRDSPGRGFVHVASKRDVQAFLDLLPDWDRLSERLERIVLAAPEGGCDGLYQFYRREETGAIFLHAWPEDLWVELSAGYYETHRMIFERLGVSSDREEKGAFCRFTAAQARAYMLLHVFLHELGHHYDKLHQKHHHTTKGEDYAEQFANRRFEQLYPAYVRAFGDPARAE